MVFLEWLRKRPEGTLELPTEGKGSLHVPAPTRRYDAFGRSVVDARPVQPSWPGVEPQPVEPGWPDDDPRWDELDLQEQIEHERRVRAATADVAPRPVEPRWPDDDPRWDELDLQEQIEHERRVRAATAKDADRGLLVAGWICAVLFPPVGVAIGIVLLMRRRVGYGLAILLLSLLLVPLLVAALFFVPMRGEGGDRNDEPAVPAYRTLAEPT